MHIFCIQAKENQIKEENILYFFVFENVNIRYKKWNKTVINACIFFRFFFIYKKRDVLHSTFFEILKREGLLIMLQLYCMHYLTIALHRTITPKHHERFSILRDQCFAISHFFPVGSIFVIVRKICKRLIYLYNVTTDFF